MEQGASVSPVMFGGERAWLPAISSFLHRLALGKQLWKGKERALKFSSTAGAKTIIGF